jgi:putative methionine-R-sulfoxide reductase with GAF domain
MPMLYILNGPDKGRSFDLTGNAVYVGRSSDNDIQIEDKTVSRRHLKFVRRGRRYFVTDLKSQNGTFFSGNYVAPGLELEAKEGVPIAIGMSVICLGKGCIEQMTPLLDTIGLTMETGKQSGIFLAHGDKTNQKKLELLYRVSEILENDLHITEALEKILDCVFDLLKRIDRAAFILTDPETETILNVISKRSKPMADSSAVYCPDVVRRVIDQRKPLAMSDVQTEEENELADTLKILHIQSVMCVPLISNSQIMGVIYIDSQEGPFGFAKEDLALFVDLCKRTAAAIDIARFASDSTTISDELPSQA